MVNSRVLKKLRGGDYVKVTAIGRVLDPWIAEVIGMIGYDVIWLDLEHRPIGHETIAPVALACRATGIDLMVRIRKSGYDSPMRALEFGANGLMIPHCRSAAEARQWVDWCKFPPQGKRGLDGAGSDADYALADMHEYVKHANTETFLALQIEDKEAVECIDEIAAVDGFDVLFVGPGDLSMSYGVPFQFDHPSVLRAYDQVANAAARSGKWWGTTTANPAIAQSVLDRGGRMITCGADHVHLLNGYKQSFEGFDKIKVRAIPE